jgi:hypothetical protein
VTHTVTEPNVSQEKGRPTRANGASNSIEHEGELDILECRQCLEQTKMLEHEADNSSSKVGQLVTIQRPQVRAGHDYLPALGLFEAT